MNLLIDNLDGQGALDYTTSIEAEGLPRIRRRLNAPAEMDVALIGDSSAFLVPVIGAHVVLRRGDGTAVFTGYLPSVPEPDYLGWGQQCPVFRYQLHAVSDEIVLDRKQLPARSPFVNRAAGAVLKELVNELAPGVFDLSGVQELDVLPVVDCDSQREWSKHAADLALCARAAYRAHDGRLVFAPIGATTHLLSEASAEFDPQGLKLRSTGVQLNDVVVTGRMEPKCYVHDYFLADGMSQYFQLSHAPFTTYGGILLDEEYKALSPLYWIVNDPTGAISVSAEGKLNVNGGSGDGLTTLCFVEKVELGSGLLLQHGEVTFNGPSNGVLGGFYSDAINFAGCLAGFFVYGSGSQSVIRAVVNGSLAGTTVSTMAGHRYALATRIYASQIFRGRETFHSSAHPAGSGRGGGTEAAYVRVMLELRDIDPAHSGMVEGPATVLFDGVFSTAAWCAYAPVNSVSLHCTIPFTRIRRISEAEIFSAPLNGPYRTRLVGDFAEGAECTVSSGPEVAFYPEYIPALNEAIVVRYRSRGRALARVQDLASIAALVRGTDDGVRAAMRAVELPAPRTSTDCENAALALLDDGGAAWSGEYSCWSDALPAAAGDLWPGDALAVSLPSRSTNFTAVVREIAIAVTDLQGDLGRYSIAFANEAASSLTVTSSVAHLSSPPEVTATTQSAGNTCIADLTGAEVTAVTSTSVTIDAGTNPPLGGGFEIRRSDSGWGPECDRNLIARVTSRTFTLTRITRVVDFYLRQYDASSRYSRYSTALHVDYPL